MKPNGKNNQNTEKKNDDSQIESNRRRNPLERSNAASMPYDAGSSLLQSTSSNCPTLNLSTPQSKFQTSTNVLYRPINEPLDLSLQFPAMLSEAPKTSTTTESPSVRKKYNTNGNLSANLSGYLTESASVRKKDTANINLSADLSVHLHNQQPRFDFHDKPRMSDSSYKLMKKHFSDVPGHQKSKTYSAGLEEATHSELKKSNRSDSSQENLTSLLETEDPKKTSRSKYNGESDEESNQSTYESYPMKGQRVEIPQGKDFNTSFDLDEETEESSLQSNLTIKEQLKHFVSAMEDDPFDLIRESIQKSDSGITYISDTVQGLEEITKYLRENLNATLEKISRNGRSFLQDVEGEQIVAVLKKALNEIERTDEEKQDNECIRNDRIKALEEASAMKEKYQSLYAAEKEKSDANSYKEYDLEEREKALNASLLQLHEKNELLIKQQEDFKQKTKKADDNLIRRDSSIRKKELELQSQQTELMNKEIGVIVSISETEAQELRNAIERMREESHDMSKTHSHNIALLKQQIAELNRQNEKLTQKNNTLTERNTSLYSGNNELTEINRKSNIEKGLLTQDNEKLTQDNEKLTQDNEKLTQDNEKLTEESRKLAQAYARSNKELDEKNTKLIEKNKKLIEENRKLTEEVKETFEENRKSTEENKKLNEEIKELYEQNNFSEEQGAVGGQLEEEAGVSIKESVERNIELSMQLAQEEQLSEQNNFSEGEGAVGVQPTTKLKHAVIKHKEQEASKH